jgi:ribosomal protein S18 acetylase RimI-like enzyme
VDIPAIVACLTAAFEPFRASYSPAGFDDTVLDHETARRRLEDMTVLVAEDDASAVVGTIGYQAAAGGEGHLRGMAVLPALVGQGVADQLLAAAESGLRAAGCTRITLDTTAPLTRAIRFYERHGYRATGRVGDFFGMALYEYAKDIA